MVQTPSRPLSSSADMPSADTQLADLLTAARTGEPGAIAQLLSRALKSQGIVAQASAEGTHLQIRLEGRHAPHQSEIAPLIQRGMARLGSPSVQSVAIRAYQAGDPDPIWNYQFRLGELTPPQPQRRPDVESLVRVHVGGSVSGEQVAIGQHITQVTHHGAIVYAQNSGKPRLQRRSKPTAQRYCSPFRNLLDRHPELQEALSSLDSGISVEFHGETGLGKSVLLRHLAHHAQVGRRFGDGIVYRLVHDQPAEDVAQFLFDAFYEYDASVPTRPTDADRRQALESLNALAVLDDVHLDAGELEAVMTLPGLTFLLGSSTNHFLSDGRDIPMRGLPIPEAVQLFEYRLGRQLAESERPEAETLCRLLKGHPLRILQVAAPLRDAERQQGERLVPGEGLRELVKTLQSGSRAEALTIRAATALPEIERRVLAVLAVFETVPLAPEHLQALVAAANLELAFQILLERGLIWTDGRRYGLASNLLQPIQQIWDLAPWMDRAIAYFKDWAAQHSRVEAGGAIAPLVQTSDALWRLTHLAAEQGRWADVIQLSQMLDRPLMLGNQWGQWRRVWELGLDAARTLGDGAAEAFALHQLGTRALCLDDAFTAHTCLTEAVQLRSALGDDLGAAVTQHNLNLLLPPLPMASAESHPEPDGALASPPPASGLTARPPQTTLARPPAPPPAAKPLVPAATTQTRAFPLTWVVVSAIAALVGGVGAFVALTWNRAPFTLEPNALAFPPQLLGVEGSPRSITVTNTGSEPIDISSVVFSEGDRLDFDVEEDCTDQPLRPDDDCTVSVLFTPREEGPRSTRLRVADATGEYVRSMTVRGVGEVAQVSFNPDGLVFDPTLAGGDRPTVLPVTVTNDSAVTFEMGQAEIVDANADAFEIAQDGCRGQVLDPRDTCTVQVAFRPPGAGNFEANLVLRDATNTNYWLNALAGTGQLSAPSISPAQLPFGPETVGTLAIDDLIVTNTGASPLTIRDVSINGDRTFSIRSNTCTRGAIQPGERCRIVVGFAPQAVRGYAANLVITDNAVNSPRQIALSGQGSAVPPVTAPRISPDSLAFGERDLDTASQERVIITNRGDRAIRIEEVTMPRNDDFGIINQTCTGGTLAPGNSCTITVGFTPQEAGDRSTSITITDTAAGSPRTIPVTGTGVSIPAPQILAFEASPTEIQAGGRSNLCYRVANVQQLSLRNDRTGQITPIDASSACIPVTPDQATTYTLIAEGRTGQSVTRQVRVRVAEPDTTPPPTPAPISPGGNDYVLCNGADVRLTWNPVSDPGGAVNYVVTLEQGGSTVQQSRSESWTRVTQQTTSATAFNITPYLERGRISYRWRVSARDAAGNESSPSGWVYFRTCDVPIE